MKKIEVSYLKRLKDKSLKLRQETFRMFIEKKEAHLGGSFSIIEILIALHEKINSRDKFILSKSHASFPLCILLKQYGLNPKITTHLEIDVKNRIYCTTGSLGHGLPIATGMAFARKKQKKDGKIYVLISDGECQEGTTWESILIATKHKLDNLVIIVDYNKIQALSKIQDVLPLDNIYKKFKSFNCNCVSIKNGHNFNSLFKGIMKIKKNEKPTVLIIDTIKGKGVKEFENDPVWHARQLAGKEIDIAKKRLKL